VHKRFNILFGLFHKLNWVSTDSATWSIFQNNGYGLPIVWSVSKHVRSDSVPGCKAEETIGQNCLNNPHAIGHVALHGDIVWVGNGRPGFPSDCHGRWEMDDRIKGF